MKLTVLALAAALVTTTACTRPANPNEPGNVITGISVPVGSEFDLSIGAPVRIEGAGLTIRLAAITEDSRCPVDVQCVWAGNAALRIQTTTDDGKAAEFTINTTTEPRSALVGAHVLRLVSLTPAPRSGTTIAPSAYIARLAIDRA